MSGDGVLFQVIENRGRKESVKESEEDEDD